MQAVVYWQPKIDPGTVILTAKTPVLRLKPTTFPEIDESSARHDPQGVSLRVESDADAIRLLLSDGARPGVPLAALIPLDESCLDSIEALTRLLQFLRGRPPVADARLTPQRRRRLSRMLQATDGHLTGATYREIANTLYGRQRVAADPWKTSALRDSAIALVRDGRALIDGGYRGLLRRQRRS